MSRNAMDACIDAVNEREDQMHTARREWLESVGVTHICPACATNYYAPAPVECDHHEVTLIRLA